MISLQKTAWGGYVADGDPLGPNYRVSIADVEADAIRKLKKVDSGLEIGTGLGVSTRAMAKLCKKVVTLDVDGWIEANIVPDLPDNVKFYMERDLVPTAKPFDAVLIDGDHTSDAVLADIAFCEPLTHAGTVWMFHDMNLESVTSAVAYAAPWLKATTEVDAIGKLTIFKDTRKRDAKRN